MPRSRSLRFDVHYTGSVIGSDCIVAIFPVGRAKVYFELGSSILSPQGKQDLQAIATQAKGHKGYRLAVVGRADPTGNAAANQRLSEARAAIFNPGVMRAVAASYFGPKAQPVNTAPQMPTEA